MDWGLDWELPDYPKLPKLFTNAKTAKKRKHKEYIVTEELLDCPVKLAKLSGKPEKPPKQQAGTGKGATETAAATATADTAAAKKQKKKLEQQSKETPKEQEQHAAAAAVQQAPQKAKADAPEQQQHEKKKKKKKDKQASVVAADAGKAIEQAQPSKPAKQQAAAAAEEHLSIAAAAGAEAAGAEAAVPKKRSKNKFKQPEFLEQQRLQAPVDQRTKTKQQQQQQQAKQQGGTGPKVAPQPAAPSSSKKKKNNEAAAAAATAAVPATATSPAATKAAASKPAATGTAAAAAGGGSGGSKLLQQFAARLQGSRFRQLNEALYTQPGDESFEMLQDQPELFQQYHEGFQQQVKAWPTQPLDAAIAWLKGKPQQMVVADFGCGDARLAATVQQEVHSLDLVACAPGVIACNMAATPLATGSCDAAVFSLALMGVDYGSFLLEAARVVKKGGWLWIAEVRSRFAGGAGSSSEDFRPFLACLQQLGFKLVKQDASNKMFVVFVLKKQQGVDAAAAKAIKWPPLKACMYKKR